MRKRHEHTTGEVDVPALSQQVARQICDSMSWEEPQLLHLTMAMYEALTNAVDHGNLELTSDLIKGDLCSTDDPFAEYLDTRKQRLTQQPFADRRVSVEFVCETHEVTITIKDQGRGFDPGSVPDPNAPENALKPFGRGITLIRTMVDDVFFNERGNAITMVKRNPA